MKSSENDRAEYNAQMLETIKNQLKKFPTYPAQPSRKIQAV